MDEGSSWFLCGTTGVSSTAPTFIALTTPEGTMIGCCGIVAVDVTGVLGCGGCWVSNLLCKAQTVRAMTMSMMPMTPTTIPTMVRTVVLSSSSSSSSVTGVGTRVGSDVVGSGEGSGEGQGLGEGVEPQ